MIAHDFEAMADRWLGKAGFALDQVPNPVALANALLGPRACKLYPPEERPRFPASLWQTQGRAYVLLRRDMDRMQMRWAVMHELGRWVAYQEGLDGPGGDQLPAEIGLRLYVPYGAVVAGLSDTVESAAVLAERWDVNVEVVCERLLHAVARDDLEFRCAKRRVESANA